MEKSLKAQVNELVKQYQAGDMEAMGEVFAILKSEEWTSKKMWRHSMLIGEHVNEIESIYTDTFMRVIDKFDPERGDFVHFLNRAIENAVKNHGSKLKTRKKVEIYEPETMAAEDGDKSRFWDIREDAAGRRIETPEEILEEELTKEEKILFQPAIVDDIAAASEDFEREVAFLYMKGNSLRDVAKMLQTNPMKIKRTINRLARKYDEKRFGDIHRYFTVITVK